MDHTTRIIIGVIGIIGILGFLIWTLNSLKKSAIEFFEMADLVEDKANKAQTRGELSTLFFGDFQKLQSKSFHPQLSARIRELHMLFETKRKYMIEKSESGFSVEYKIIKDFYGNQVAKRSQVPLINHINEGIDILTTINASVDAIAAYCLHPIIQSDDAIVNNMHLLDNYNNSRRLILTMEYRRVANAYLSKREIKSLDEIELSPLHEVNQMLWADKLQNQKDFREYHLGKHERSEILEQYFINWINKLEPIIKG